MGFFLEFEAPEDARLEPEPRRVRWRGDPEDTVGVAVPLSPVLVRDERVAIVAAGFVAYPAGFTFSLVVISRLSPSPMPLGPHPGRGPRASADGDLRFGIEFADGSKVTNQRHRRLPGEETPVRILRPSGGGGGGRKYSQGFWCEPLPPPGAIVLVCDWREFDVAETSLEVDAAGILDAASRAVPLWPEDQDLAEEPRDPSMSPRVGWASRSFGPRDVR